MYNADSSNTVCDEVGTSDDRLSQTTRAPQRADVARVRRKTKMILAVSEEVLHVSGSLNCTDYTCIIDLVAPKVPIMVRSYSH